MCCSTGCRSGPAIPGTRSRSGKAAWPSTAVCSGWRWRSRCSPGAAAATLPALGLFFGRLGNFINGELWGKVTTVPWGFLYHGQVRHPSQLYEATLEGLVTFVVLWAFTARPRPRLAPSGLFLL